MKHIKNFKLFESIEAKPGETIEVQADLPIRGEVYLTDSDIAYHGGLIDNIDDYLSKTGLYLTKSKGGAVSWNLKGHLFTRLYEVKIKKGSKFINSSPAGKDVSTNRLNDEKEALLPLGIVGMTDNKFRSNIDGGDVMTEGLILHKSAIESFRVVPFREILNDKNLRNRNVDNPGYNIICVKNGTKIDNYVTIEKLYIAICTKVFRKEYPDITQKIKSGELERRPFKRSYPLSDESSINGIESYIRKNKNIQSEIDNIVESMSNEELEKFILSK